MAHRMFHRPLYGAAHNEILVATLDGLWDKADWYRLAGLHETRDDAGRADTAAEHQAMVEAVLAGDGAAAIMRATSIAASGRRACRAWRMNRRPTNARLKRLFEEISHWPMHHLDSALRGIIMAEEHTDLLSISHERRGAAVIVRFVGEIDLTSVGSMRAALAVALGAAAAPHPIVLDLTGVGFLASAGLAELAVAHERAAEQDTPLRIVATGRAVLRPLEVTGVAESLDIRPDLTVALAPPVDQTRDRPAR